MSPQLRDGSRRRWAPSLGFADGRGRRRNTVSKFWRTLFVILAIAFGIRVLYVAIAKSGQCTITLPSGIAKSPSQCAGPSDQVFYNSEANSLAQSVPIGGGSHTRLSSARWRTSVGKTPRSRKAAMKATR